MYNVSVEDTGNHPDKIIAEVRKCLVSCLKKDPASMDELRQRLVSQLSRPAVMGGLYRSMTVSVSDHDDTNHYVHVQVHVGGRGRREQLFHQHRLLLGGFQWPLPACAGLGCQEEGEGKPEGNLPRGDQ